MLNHTSAVQENLPLFAMLESLADIKKMTSLDNDVIFYPSTQKPNSLTTLGADLTSNEKGLSPYWTESCAAISSQLWLPTGIDSLDLDLSLSSIWSNRTVDQSWFSTKLFTAQQKNLPPIFSRSLLSSALESTDSESTVTKSKKIRLWLSREQQKKVNHWLDVSRFVYNQTIAYLKEPGTVANWKAIKTDLLNSLPDFCDDVPFQIKSVAIRDACIAVRSAKAKYRKGDGTSDMRFRSRKNPVQSCYIPKSAIKPQGIYYTIIGNLRYNEVLPEDMMDSRIVRQYGKYYLAVPYKNPRHVAENQGRVVALDPGVRNFVTFFSEDSYGWLGKAANLVIQKLCFRLDDLISRMSKVNAKRKRSMQKAADRLRERIANLVDELHKKIARFLCTSFDIILLPTFETSQMANKAKRRIRSKSVRQMLTLSHYKFRMFLKHKAFELGKTVIDVCEAYTSKTVSWTGEIVSVGGRKVIQSTDGTKMDRDLNGARGIFLRAVVDTPLLRDNLSDHFVSVC